MSTSKRVVFVLMMFLFLIANAQKEDWVQYVNTLQGTNSNWGLQLPEIMNV